MEQNNFNGENITWTSANFNDIALEETYKGVFYKIIAKDLEILAKIYSDEDYLFVVEVKGDKKKVEALVKYFSFQILKLTQVKILGMNGYNGLIK